MNLAAAASQETVKKILLATDLSSHCDRATDRALILAREWGAKLVAMTVIEQGSTFHAASVEAEGAIGRDALSRAQKIAESQLRADLGLSDLPLVCRVGQGTVSDSILSACDAEQAGVLVAGVARNEPLDRDILGPNVDALVRRASVPVLIVRNRARAPYRVVAIATDFSSSSRRALKTAVSLFPNADFRLFHAFGSRASPLANTNPEEALGQALKLAASSAEKFMQSCDLSPSVSARFKFVLVYGDPVVKLRDRSFTNPSDLIVVGTAHRRGLVNLFIGSVAKRILEESGNDILIVPP